MSHPWTTAIAVLCVTLATGMVGQGDAANLPNAAPLTSMERARSYALLNRSTEAIVEAHISMTNGDVRDLTWQQSVQPGQGRDIAVPSTDCMRSVVIKLKSGRTLESTGAPDCRLTRITVTNSNVTMDNSATNRPPVSN